MSNGAAVEGEIAPESVKGGTNKILGAEATDGMTGSEDICLVDDGSGGGNLLLGWSDLVRLDLNHITFGSLKRLTRRGQCLSRTWEHLGLGTPGTGLIHGD